MAKRFSECSRSEAKRVIIIDFEGRKPINENEYPDQILLGAWGPFGDGGSYEYRGWLFNPKYKPITKSMKFQNKVKVEDLPKAIETILSIAGTFESKIGCYSEHELNVIAAKAPALHSQVEERVVNVRQVAEAAAKHKGVFEKPWSLDTALSALDVRRVENRNLQFDMAEYEEALIKAGENSQRWSNWKNHQKQKSIDLIEYNRADVKNTYQLLRRSVNINEHYGNH